MARPKTHGMAGTPLYDIWCTMKQRCYDSNFSAYPHYGARGIEVCDSWLNYPNFYQDVSPRPSSNAQLDRIDNDGNYSLENCQWVTPAENSRKRSSSKLDWNKVREIRALYATGEFNQRELANQFGVHRNMINRIVNYKRWASEGKKWKL